MDKIQLIHGDGGEYTSELIRDIFYSNFSNDILLQEMDSGIFKINSERLAFTTDSFIIDPIFFRGGDIGKLSICGTINDLTVCGAYPLYLSAGFIIEEGFPISMLKDIVSSMNKTCSEAKVKIITGDTKVVEKGKADGIFINTAGIGVIDKFSPKKIEAGDSVIITGTIAEHGTAIAVDRYELDIHGDIKSDCEPLNHLLSYLLKYEGGIKLMRDPTRGGVGQVLNEISRKSNLGIHLFEENIPIRKEVKAINEMLGLDPLYLASEGRIIIIADKSISEEIKNGLQSTCGCQEASILGHFTEEERLVYIENSIGGRRVLNSLDFQMLPRIC